jgi:pyridoxamine 5'-phosphate oxidase
MEKAAQILFGSDRADSTDHQLAGKDDASDHSGGSAPFEAVWWVKDGGIMTQWRIRGIAWIVGPDVEENDLPGPKRLKTEIELWMREKRGENQSLKKEAETNGGWSWLRELTYIFGGQSPGIRGTQIPS